MFGLDDRAIRFVVDKSFFHDALRTEYDHPRDAEWMLFYSIVRHSIEPYERIFLASSLVLDGLEQEFRSYPYISPQITQVIRRVVDVVTFTRDIPIDVSTIYTVVWLAINDTIPVIISSVKKSKWLERIKIIGTKLSVEGYSRDMSEKRVEGTFPGYLVDFKKSRDVLEDHDSLYEQVTALID